MPSQQLTEAREKLQAKRDAIAEVFDQAKSTDAGGEGVVDFRNVTCLGFADKKGSAKTIAVAERVGELNAELTVCTDEVLAFEKAEKAQDAVKAFDETTSKRVTHEAAGAKGAPAMEYKGPGSQLVETEIYKKQWQKGNKSRSIMLPNFGLDELKGVKANFVTTAGWAPENLRLGRVIDDAQRPIQVTDLIPSGATGNNSVVYMEETTFTNSAAEAAEAGAYAESALALTEQTSPVQKVATFIPASDEQLADVAQAQSYLDNRLRFMVRQRLDSQILVGDGTPPNLDGFLNVAGIQTQAKAGDPAPDAIYKAMDLVRVTGRATPNAVIAHPTDWQAIQLLRTADGVYIWGNPADAANPRIWGLPVVLSDAITLNTMLVGDYANYTQLFERQGLEVKMTDSHASYFTTGLNAIRASIRVALVVYRPAALCTVTGM